MKDHIDIELLSRYVDNMCSAAEKELVGDHISECESCMKTVRMLKNAAMVMPGLKAKHDTAELDRAFYQKLEARKKSGEGSGFGDLFRDAVMDLGESLGRLKPVLAKAAVFACIIVASYAALNFMYPEEPCIKMVMGDASVYDSSKHAWVKPGGGMVLAKGDMIDVKRGSYVDIAVKGRYIMRVKEGARIKVAKLPSRYIRGTTEYDVEKGKALISIEKGFKGSKFITRTPQAVGRALGTQFMVDVAMQPAQQMTKFGVIDGSVDVASLSARKSVVVESGEATEVLAGAGPSEPRQLMLRELQEMVEFYQIGKKEQIALVISNGKYRVKELLRPCPLLISDFKPRTISRSLEETVAVIDRAIKENDKEKHLEGIRRLEEILVNYPSPEYEPQLRLFIGAYYNYLNMPAKAIASFADVADKYPRSTFASMALCAMGIVYQESLSDTKASRGCFDMVLTKYKDSPEARYIKELGRK